MMWTGIRSPSGPTAALPFETVLLLQAGHQGGVQRIAAALPETLDRAPHRRQLGHDFGPAGSIAQHEDMPVPVPDLEPVLAQDPVDESDLRLTALAPRRGAVPVGLVPRRPIGPVWLWLEAPASRT